MPEEYIVSVDQYNMRDVHASWRSDFNLMRINPLDVHIENNSKKSHLKTLIEHETRHIAQSETINNDDILIDVPKWVKEGDAQFFASGMYKQKYGGSISTDFFVHQDYIINENIYGIWEL